MTTFHHTPSPWHLDPSEMDHVIDDDYHVVGGGSAEDAFQFAGFMRTEDARLIAAAPDLLEALDALMSLESRGRLMPVGKEWDAARAAIAKAVGGEE